MQIITGPVSHVRPDGDGWQLCINGEWHTLQSDEFFRWWHATGTEFKAKVEGKCRTGMSRDKAVDAVNRENPGLTAKVRADSKEVKCK